MKKIVIYTLLVCFAITLSPVSAFADTSELITYEQPKNWYDYVIDKDPMQISDEEFFGVWDSELEMWTSRPYFRYDDFDGMLPVKEAAMEGC